MLALSQWDINCVFIETHHCVEEALLPALYLFFLLPLSNITYSLSSHTLWFSCLSVNGKCWRTMEPVWHRSFFHPKAQDVCVCVARRLPLYHHHQQDQPVVRSGHRGRRADPAHRAPGDPRLGQVHQPCGPGASARAPYVCI